MLDIRVIRADPDLVKAGHRKKGVTAPVDEVLALDAERRTLLQELEELKAERNRASERVAARKKAGEAADDLIRDTRVLGTRIQDLEGRLRPVEEALDARLLELPNLPHPSVPEGAGEADNPLVSVWGRPRTDAVLPHWELGEALDILDFERAHKISGARFTVLKGFAARLSRALIHLMLAEALERGYQEIAPPYLVLPSALYGTGQFPKFREDVFRVLPDERYLIPTAEVPLVNLRAQEILAAAELPVNYCAYTPSFRSEAGAAGRDTRGIVRQHQFDKVELVKLVHPTEGLAELERMREDAENILRKLVLPYRVVEHCGGDLGFGHHKAYDLDVWMPSYGRYVEISSVSLMSDFQARRAGIRFRPEGGRGTEFVYTLNGSALAVGRTLAAILENYQQAPATPGGVPRVAIPDVLVPFFNGATGYPFD